MKEFVIIGVIVLSVVGGMTSHASAFPSDSWDSNWGGGGYTGGDNWGGGGYTGGGNWGGGGGGTTAAPEPTSLLLLSSGLVGLWAVNRKRE